MPTLIVPPDPLPDEPDELVLEELPPPPQATSATVIASVNSQVADLHPRIASIGMQSLHSRLHDDRLT
jgi:hypothetical protein